MTIAEKIVAVKNKINILIIIIKKENENRAIFKGTIEQFAKNTKIIQYINNLDLNEFAIKFHIAENKGYVVIKHRDDSDNSTDTNSHQVRNIDPRECLSIVRDQTLILENKLTKASFELGNEPLKLYHNAFARFNFVIINSNKKPASASIKVNEIPYIMTASDYAAKKELDLSLTKSDDEKLDVAYTAKIITGKHAGKTPAQLLLDVDNIEENKQFLISYYNWLKENLSKYPNNKHLMQAISNATNMYKEGKLKDIKVDNADEMMIYNSGYRFNIRKQREDGKTLIKELSIKWIFKRNYPVQICIKNYYAPVKRNDDGTVNVLAKESSDHLINTMNLSFAEWENMKYMIKTSMRLFENSISEECLEYALKTEKKIIQAIKMT
ncbi:MAG TPA: hypothetical protein H9980_09120 [Candidatus Erysipelatoclostridium merdavium]|uniref:Uncharacterized protein n=1 Tax=Candidatus Erysipelatoclostridium merdavium TaxID=2838566 RepID=A0A9D1XME2_9FIRM|nr:hypothetical protein [Candidatus Erysipelatoclostridium merdavium]